MAGCASTKHGIYRGTALVFTRPDDKIDFNKMMGRNFYDQMMLGVACFLTGGSILSRSAI